MTSVLDAFSAALQHEQRVSESIRNLYRAAYNGLAATGHGKDTILLGELLPVGKSSKTTRSSIRPLEFLREVACVDRRYHAYRGRSAKVRGCTKFKAIPISGIAHHPYALAGGPTKRPPSRDDVTIGTLSRLTKVVDRLRARPTRALSRSYDQ